MTPQEFLIQYFEIIDTDQQCHDSLIAECLYDDINDCDLDELFLIMKEYSKVMCQKQREICSEEAELKFEYIGDGSWDGSDIVDKDSILNSPLPEELKDEN